MDNAFSWGGNNASTVAYSITWSEDLVNGVTILHLDNTGNTSADMQIVLVGTGLLLDATDFVL